MLQYYFKRSEIDDNFQPHMWESVVFKEFETTLTSTIRPFYWENGEAICQAGDVIELPKGIKHGSIAINGDAKYIITFKHIDLS